MINNTLKMAYRGYLRNKTFSSINLLNLVVGILVTFLSVTYISYELGFDRFHSKEKQLYKLIRKYRAQDYSIIGFKSWSDTEGVDQVNSIKDLKSVPNVADATQFVESPYPAFLSRDNQQQIEVKDVLSTNTPKSFVNMFTWKLINGSFKDFEVGFNKAILTKSVAEKLFGKRETSLANAVNSPVNFGGQTYQIVGIMEDVPSNSHFDFTIALSTPRIDYWGSRVYVETKKGTKISSTEAQVSDVIAKSNQRLIKDELYEGHYLQPISDVHFDASTLYPSKTPGNLLYVSLIGFFGLFIFIMTLFNYTNLNLAIKSKQTKSLGVMKTLGSSNGLIIQQMIAEGLMLALISLPIIAVTVYLLVPEMNQSLNLGLNYNLLASSHSAFLLLGLALITGLIASTIPALILNNKKVLSLLTEKFQYERTKGLSIRKYLLISQFVALLLISSVSYYVYKQLKFIENKEVGFNKDNIIYTYTSPDNIDVFQQKLRQIPGITHVGNGSNLGIESVNQGTYRLENSEEVFSDATTLYMDFEALKAYDLKTDFVEIPNVRTNIINRAAALKLSKATNIPIDELKGKTIITEPEYVNEENGQVGFPMVIGGIFEDINLYSLREKVSPIFLILSEQVRSDGRSIISYDKSNLKEILSTIKSEYNSLNETAPLEISYLAEDMSRLYEEEKKTGRIFLFFTIVAILISALGLIGITLFLMQARAKEFSIRKVLGASDFILVKVATKEYFLLLGLAFVSSWPLAWYITKQWLDGFAYSIEINQFVFVIMAVLVYVFIAIIVGGIAYLLSNRNPVKNLSSD